MNNEVLNTAPIDYQATPRIVFVRCKKTALLALCQYYNKDGKYIQGRVDADAVWVRVPTLDLTLTDK